MHPYRGPGAGRKPGPSRGRTWRTRPPTCRGGRRRRARSRGSRRRGASGSSSMCAAGPVQGCVQRHRPVHARARADSEGARARRVGPGPRRITAHTARDSLSIPPPFPRPLSESISPARPQGPRFASLRRGSLDGKDAGAPRRSRAALRGRHG